MRCPGSCALLLVGTAVLGCGKKAVVSPPAVELTVWHTFNTEETGTFNRVLERVREAHPGVRIWSTIVPFSRAQASFLRAVEGCGPGAPDLFRAELPWLPELVERGLVRAAPSSIPGETAYEPVARALARYRGQRWALPASLDGLALLYNRRLIAQPPRTLSELVETARKLTTDERGRHPGEEGFTPARVARWGFYVRAESYWFLPVLWGLDGDLLDPRRGQIFVDRPEASGALGFYRDLIHVHHVAPPNPGLASDYDDQLRRFGQGEVAMIFNGPWSTSAILATSAFREAQNLGVAPLPVGRAGKPVALLSGHGFVVSRCARRPELAWRVAAALTDHAAQREFARANTLLPTMSAVYGDPALGERGLVRKFRAALDGARLRPAHPFWTRIFDDFTPAVEAVLLGDAEPGEALAGVARAWRRGLGSRAREARHGGRAARDGAP
ncbi:MAG: extracellular solute-binding protein [Deltaproteobacteria bacterium]|nr:extracellular solute-binding protein [Deltaproteobacteria bacterium]